ncbi:hypothetical protein GCM10025867_08710 [Frondihabitans sucicola]|uniref:XRE family transcriptional regulator n=1 Tax=Frondihabitans sucicola TaxID=1268041 RepID=A0ABN6XYA9_9MICO|nr:hypothetical protein [Frondihabitans sucicola]BDZ48630.1 hypothetical protein GCM10025867_08710 [Frondihabitans sucicola]
MTNAENHDATLDALLAAAAYVPPALENDAAARLLGLVPDSTSVLNPAALKRARMKLNLTTSALANHLTVRGWRVTTAEVFQWETRKGTHLAPALIATIADELELAETDLVTSTVNDSFRALRDDSRFKELVERWARLKHISRLAAAASLESRSLQAVHRGGPPEVELQLAVITAFVEEVENRES